MVESLNIPKIYVLHKTNSYVKCSIFHSSQRKNVRKQISFGRILYDTEWKGRHLKHNCCITIP